jgi:drug/metabolite transporter (DMT)-like permease
LTRQAGRAALPASTSVAGPGDRSLWRGSALVACSAVTFGAITTLGRLAYDGGSNPLTVVLLRLCTFVCVVGLLLVALRRPGRLTLRAFLATLWMAVTLTMMSVGYLGSVAFIPVSLAALIFYSFPLLVGVIAAADGRERMTGRKAVALMVAFVGLALALGPSFSTLDWRGVALAFTAALGMGFTVTYGGEAVRGQDTLAMNFYTNLWMLIGLALYLAMAGGVTLPATRLGWTGAAGVCLCYVLAFVSWFLAARRIGPVRVAALFNIEPLVSIFCAWLLLGERLGPVQLAGAALVLGSVVAVTLAGTSRRQ